MLQEATARLLDTAVQASGEYRHHPKQEVLDAMLQLMNDLHWEQVYLTAQATPLRIFQVCKEAAEQGRLPDSEFGDRRISEMAMAMLYTCGEPCP
jgi:hypothetical protein